MLVLTIIFIFSGAAGLIYESVWSRYLGLFVGHSAYAQVIVLVIFLGGMSVGAFIAGERSSRLSRPLRQYAYIELAAGLLGIAFHYVYVQVTGLAYDSLFPGLAATGGVPFAKWTIAALLILPQSILLGTTFPLMSAAAIRLFPGRPGRDLSLLYFANSFGAAAGVLLAGFLLLRLGGLPGSLLTAGLINIGVFAAALLADKRLSGAAHPDAAPSADATPAAAQASDVQRSRGKRRSKRTRTAAAPVPGRAANWIVGALPDSENAESTPLALLKPSASSPRRLSLVLLAVSFGTAVASFIYEIAWVRMLSLVLGSATHAFELMLSAFILGLALGAYAVRSWVDRFRYPVLVLGIVQWGMGLLALATLPLYVASFHWAADFQAFFSGRTLGYEGYTVARYALCLVIMLPATFLAGMTLPLITRTLLVAGAGERVIGRVYAINTFGSITGVLLAAVVLMPVLGLRNLLALGALLDMAIGLALILPVLRRRFLARPVPVYAGLAATVALVAATLLFVQLDRALLTGGVFRYGSDVFRRKANLLFYKDGRTATVSVRETPGQLITLVTNGKPDAAVPVAWMRPSASGEQLSLLSDQSTQILLPIVTLAHTPRARTAAVIGQGSGLTSHFLLGSPHLAELATIEIEPEMLAGSRVFYPLNRRVFDDPRSRVVVDDAKSYFATRPNRFDVIISEPSNPWVSGVSGLFTVEFYERMQRHLAADGVLGQWLHLYEMTDAMVMSVLSAVDQVFGDYAVFVVAPGDILIVASPSAPLPRPDWSVVDLPMLRSDLERVPPLTEGTFERLRIAGRTVLHPMLRGVRPNSDFHPVLDLAAERARYARSQAWGLMSLTERWFDIPAVLEGRRLGFGTDTLSVTPGIPRVDGAALGARLRLARDRGLPSGGRRPTRRANFAAAAGRLANLRELAATGEAPGDWRRWLLTVVLTERDLHFGTSGVADERFYAEMVSYARTHGAPAELLATMQFLHAMRVWDFETVRQLSPVLEAAHRRGDPWLSPDALREGTVVAHLMAGDTARARERLEALTPLGDNTDIAYLFRTRMLRGAIGD